jgi:hypothetical protein
LKSRFVAEHCLSQYAHWQLGYQRFLYLLTKFPFAMERSAFAPTPGIDLVKSL